MPPSISPHKPASGTEDTPAPDDLKATTLVRIVDDDEEVRTALSFMLACRGWRTEAWGSAEAFLRSCTTTPPGCLLLDIRMPGMSGIELQERMKALSIRLPIIFITGHGDVRTAVRTLKAGAFDFLEKPVDGDALESAIRAASAISAARDGGRPDADEVRRILSEMSPREREITVLLSQGLANRDIALRLSLSERTVQGHRNNVYHKLRVHSLRQFREAQAGTASGRERVPARRPECGRDAIRGGISSRGASCPTRRRPPSRRTSAGPRS